LKLRDEVKKKIHEQGKKSRASKKGKWINKSNLMPPVWSASYQLAEFYPKHIEKEDKVFFPSCRAYFTDEEDQAMLAEFFEFDQKMIHEKYKSVVEGLETYWEDSIR
jgi:hemerythrin-like domain-containing protein